MMNVFNKMTDAENIRAGDPYDDPAFERLAREHDVWGRAESALCAVFWLAGKGQPPSGQSAADQIAEASRPLPGIYRNVREAYAAGFEDARLTALSILRAQPAAATVSADAVLRDAIAHGVGAYVEIDGRQIHIPVEVLRGERPVGGRNAALDFPPLPSCCDTGPRCGDDRCEESAQPAAATPNILREYAEGRIDHAGNGLCPDAIEGHDSRDPDCPVCQALDAASTVPADDLPKLLMEAARRDALTWADRVAIGRAIAVLAAPAAQQACQHQFYYFGDQVKGRRCVRCDALESRVPPAAQTKVEASFEALKNDLRIIEADRKALRDELNRRTALENGSIWYWQGDGNDNLDSLTCDVVIRADALRALIGAPAVQASQQPPGEALAEENSRLRIALQFYANGDHFIRHDSTAWDTVSGEPSNLYEDEANTATVEDGTFALIALRIPAMPQATIQDPLMVAAPQAGEDARPVALKEHGAWDGLEALDDLPDGTELYATPRPVGRVVAYRLLDGDGAPESEWFDGSPGSKSTPTGCRYELAYATPQPAAQGGDHEG